jgi:hypothetical protein
MEKFTGETLQDPVLGKLELYSGPEDIYLWKGRTDGKVPVNIMLEGSSDLAVINMDHCRSVVGNEDQWLDRGILFLQEQLKADPAFFGLDKEASDELISMPPDHFPVYTPTFIFYPGEEWLLHFSEGDLPICEPYGVSVLFNGETPVSVDDLSEGEFDDEE